MQMIRYEHPLSEKVRIYLRLEYLIRQMTHASQLTDPWQHQIFFRALFDMLEILDQIQLKSELAKDLEKQRGKLKQWLNIDGVDQNALLELLDKLDLAHHQLLTATRLGQELREDRFLSSIKQRLSIPGGSCSFDLPTLHHWLHLPLAHKQSNMQNWLNHISELSVALHLWLKLIRESGQFRPQVARGGFFQHDAEAANMLRIDICSSHGVYPMISGHRSRFAVRFLPFEEGTGIAELLEFKLAIC
ncbi:MULTISPECIES: cell division protein ZapD [Photobacterium]|uniref:Cell division protein ZapD n=1 Tax=Photobacterium ganghwense TaxID=320778 RepID=A0A0J1H3J8_9GAMM|nr:MULTISPECIES: cell division protein ZapD [Photobacterium]KLV06340.1 cell division protein ZapD [Photobacterium ganghwense]PSU06704.1 cell division protein ZapD [Photobacterium ganghwense]QSV14451.1 cell division protein ZapD [Photobacterium ganghwense]